MNLSRTAVKATKRNNELRKKPNEDYVLKDNKRGIYIVCDGVTRLDYDEAYPPPNIARQISRLFSHTVYKSLTSLLRRQKVEVALAESIKAANVEVWRFNKAKLPEIDYLKNDFAGTVAIIGIIENQRFYYAYNGDCGGYLIDNGKVTKFTVEQTRKIATFRQRRGYSNEVTQEIRKIYRNNRNHPLGFGVFTGEEAALDFVEYGNFQVKPGQKIILTSDGLLDLISRFPEKLLKTSPQKIFEDAEILERELNLRSDDKSIVIISILS